MNQKFLEHLVTAPKQSEPELHAVSLCRQLAQELLATRADLAAAQQQIAPDLLAESRAAEKLLSDLLAALNKATALGATRVDVGDLRVAVEYRVTPLRAAIAKAEGLKRANGGVT